MKTLTQIEPRRPISSAPFTINTPGSYYLTQSITVGGGNAITISSDDVALDLNGFTISSTANPAAGSGVLLNGTRTNIAIRNGRIKGQVTFDGSAYSGAGFLRGISGNATPLKNIAAVDLAVSGCQDEGIDLGSSYSSTVVRCVVHTVGGIGIIAGAVHLCSAQECGGSGILAKTASDSIGVSAAAGNGVEAHTVSNCSGESLSGAGIQAVNASNCRGVSLGGGIGLSATMASNCRGQSDSGLGLFATAASNCSGLSTSGTGLSATTASNCVGSSTTGPLGISSNGTVSYCWGARAGGTAISANIAIGCTSGGGTITAPGGKFLGTP
jgi:hypothetical protein